MKPSLRPSRRSLAGNEPHRMKSEHGEHKDISALTARTLSARALFLLEQVAKAARDSGSRTFIVGGSVRDILLRRPHYDLDIAIEGDAGALAGELERRGVGRVV